MDAFAHIAEREFYHFFMAGSFYWIAFFVLSFFEKKKPYLYRLTMPGLVTAGIIFLREPSDVQAGDWLGKSYIDYAFWLLGFASAAYAMHRFLTSDLSRKLVELFKKQ